MTEIPRYLIDRGERARRNFKEFTVHPADNPFGPEETNENCGELSSQAPASDVSTEPDELEGKIVKEEE